MLITTKAQQQQKLWLILQKAKYEEHPPLGEGVHC
jgi:hypothetical protein